MSTTLRPRSSRTISRDPTTGESVRGGLPRAFELQDRGLAGGDRKKALEHPARFARVRRLRQPYVGGGPVGKDKRRRAKDSMHADRLRVIALEGLEDARVYSVLAEPLDVQTAVHGHALHDLDLIDVKPVAMPRFEERHMKVVKTGLAASGLGGLEGKPSPHRLACGRIPHGPPFILGVDLRQREVPPGDV